MLRSAFRTSFGVFFPCHFRHFKTFRLTRFGKKSRNLKNKIFVAIFLLKFYVYVVGKSAIITA